MFENPGNTVQKIAKFCFVTCLIIAVLIFFVGFCRIMSAVTSTRSFGEVMAYTAEDYARGLSNGHDWYVDGYKGKMHCKTAIYIAVASLSVIPLYAFGCLVEDVAAIRKKLQYVCIDLENIHVDLERRASDADDGKSSSDTDKK